MWSKSFIIVTLLYGDPRPTLDDHVFPDPVSCHTYLHQAYDRATIECSSSIAQRNE